MSSGSSATEAGTLIGHGLPQAILARALQSGRIPHAYLFHGPKGVGKFTAARLLASAVQCLQLRERIGSEAHPGLQPCGTCDSCRRVAAGTHADVVEVEPDTATGQNISVRQACAVVGNVALRPKTGPRRLFLIGQAELLSEDAANTLLKTLEEPGLFATLVLCAPGLDHLLPTIVSRCQPVRFDPVGPFEIAAALAARFGLSPEQAAAAASASSGRPGLAIAALSDPGVEERRKHALDVFTQAFDVRRHCRAEPGRMVEALRLADALRALGQEAREGETGGPARPLKSYLAELLEVGQNLVRDILVLTAGGPETALGHPEQRPVLEEQARTLTPESASGLARLIAETVLLLDRNVSPSLALERLFLNFVR